MWVLWMSLRPSVLGVSTFYLLSHQAATPTWSDHGDVGTHHITAAPLFVMEFYPSQPLVSWKAFIQKAKVITRVL